MTTPSLVPVALVSATPAGPTPAAVSKALREKEALVARTESTKKQKNIDRVWAALEDMRARKETDFSLASVAKAIERLGLPGPKYQSLRNRDGADFKALIDAYRQEHGRAPKAAQESEDGDEDLPLAIADPRIQHRVRVLLREKRILADRNKILHEQVVRLSSTPALPTSSTTATASSAGASSFSADEIDAVRHFMERMESVGLLPDHETGCILDRRSDREVAPPYFLDALKRILSTAGGRPADR